MPKFCRSSNWISAESQSRPSIVFSPSVPTMHSSEKAARFNDEASPNDFSMPAKFNFPQSDLIREFLSWAMYLFFSPAGLVNAVPAKLLLDWLESPNCNSELFFHWTGIIFVLLSIGPCCAKNWCSSQYLKLIKM